MIASPGQQLRVASRVGSLILQDTTTPMTQTSIATRLDRPVDDASDHSLGPPSANVVLMEYGSYACPQCRAADERIAELRNQFGDRLRYVFLHRPIPGHALERRAAHPA